jgi:hypothetical protein
MTEEDKQLIAEYMGWTYHQTDDKKWWNLIGKDGSTHLLDLNDASLCVQEMQKRGGDYWHFYLVAEVLYRADEEGAYIHCNETESCAISRWLFNAENFFAALARWLREGK